MNAQIELEDKELEILEENLTQIFEIATEKGIVFVPFSEEMSETKEINEVLQSTRFLKKSMQLTQFYLIASSEMPIVNNSFEFSLCFGSGEDTISHKKIHCTIQYLRDEKEGDTVIRTFEEEGKEPLSHTHCLFNKKLSRLSSADRKIFTILTSKFLDLYKEV